MDDCYRIAFPLYFNATTYTHDHWIHTAPTKRKETRIYILEHISREREKRRIREQRMISHNKEKVIVITKSEII